MEAGPLLCLLSYLFLIVMVISKFIGYPLFRSFQFDQGVTV